ncbi:S-layer homology domain-containing protein [Brevibacillus invocatus]|uniref:S-layer homology domain-containing protein n=1 Tax=Brevibacillus invocatus TaxID=173959 RepID=UPI00203FFC2E|nr:S-layer homology domain-containing protein [Brevibacillus invocatus]MCM3431311.1 S-layer homology domain-containing protein [Brevibacillus invocatus]
MQNFKKRSAQACKTGLVGAVLVGMLGLPNLGFAATALPLSDIAQNPNKDSILKLNYAGVLKGYTDGTFRPQNEVTRAEFAKVAVLAMGYTEEQAKLLQGTTVFKDLPANHWATGYINLAVSQGIIKGYPDGTFKPNNNVKIAEALTVYVQGLKINVNASAVGEWYYPYLLEANKAGLYDSAETPTVGAKRDIVSKYTSRFMETPVYANGAYYDRNGNADGTNQKLPVVKGVVSSYNKTTKKLKITGQNSEITVSDKAQVYGNIVVGAQVQYIVNKGNIDFLIVSTAESQIVEGVVKTGLNFSSAIGDEKQFKAIVKGKEIVLEVVNGVNVSRTNIGQKFVAVLGDDGRVESITFSKNTTTGLIEKISAVSGTNAKKELKVGSETYVLTNSATIKGKAHPQAKEATASFADMGKGDQVELTMDEDGKVTAVVYTKLTATETIKVDTDDNLIIIGSVKYEVFKDTELIVDEEEVDELDELQDGKLAVLTFDEDGLLKKVEQGTKVASNKVVADTTAYQAGPPVNLATIKVDKKTYDILATAKLTIDGKKVSATTIKENQLNDYRIISWKYNLGTNDIVELEVESQTVKGYVTKKSGDKITVNGKVYELASGVTIDNNAATNDKEYTLTLDSEGKVKAVSGALKTVSGIVEEVEIREDNGEITSAKITVDGEKYTVDNEDAVEDLEQFEYVTLTLNRDQEVTAASAQGKKEESKVSFIGIESRVNGDKYVYFDDVSTSLKMAENAKVKYYDGSDMKESDVKKTDKVDLWTKADGQVYVIVVLKR